MLVSVDCTGKKGSIFECDRCKKRIHAKVEYKYRITVYKTPRDYAKTNSWDLCGRCYRALCRGIEKGVTKKDGTNIQREQTNNKRE